MNSHSTFALTTLLFVLTTGAQPEASTWDDSDAPPVVSTGGNVGDDYLVDCNNSLVGGSFVTSIQLDGSGSYDPDGTKVTFDWHNECQYGWFDDPTSPTPVYHVDMTEVCERDCWIALRVTSDGQTTIKGFQVFVVDATPPLISPPYDYLGIWGDSTDAETTGTPMVTDNCDPTPLLTYTDVVIPATGPGQPELNLQRTWRVVDCQGFEASVVQSIQLVAPTGLPGSQANMDFDPRQCPNYFPLAETGSVEIVLLGSASFRVEKVDPLSLRLSLPESPGVFIAPNSIVVRDAGSIVATAYGECNSNVPDGYKDLKLRFDRLNIAAQFALARFPGQSVEFMVTGNKVIGQKLFGTRDIIVIQ
jgi:hypothetical protein